LIVEGVGLLALIALLIIGFLILVVLIKAVLFFLIPGIMAIVVWFLTNDPFLTGVAFLAVAVLCIVFRR